MNYEIIKFENGNVELEVNVSPEEETVWLSKEQIAQLFDRDRSVISKHIRNVFAEDELDEKSNVHFLHIRSKRRRVPAQTTIFTLNSNVYILNALVLS